MIGLFMLVVLVVLGGIGLVGGWMSTRGPGVTIVHGETMPAAAPQEWLAQSAWRTPALLPQAGRTLVVNAGQVAVVTHDRQVALIDAASGDLRWSADYPDGPPKTPLAASVIDGQNVLAAQVGDRLAWWDAATGQAGKGADLPEGAQAVFAGTAPLIMADSGRRGWLIQNGATAEVSIPEGAKALAGRSDGVAVVAGSNGWWHVRPGRQPGPAGRWEMPGEDRAP
ncbi:MAG: PQQ-binding-like beta-propeller repeat protein, partial [Dermatophilaceae bacterium]